MPYTIKNPPATDKERLVNHVKLVANYVELATPESLMAAEYALGEIVEKLENERTHIKIGADA